MGFANLCNFISHNGMPVLQRGFCTHCLVTLTHRAVNGLWIPVPHHLQPLFSFMNELFSSFHVGLQNESFRQGKMNVTYSIVVALVVSLILQKLTGMEKGR